MEITENESIFLQALSTTSLLAELHNNKFLGSEYYKKLSFSNNSLKEILELSGIGNPATMQMFLYILLVVPKEIAITPLKLIDDIRKSNTSNSKGAK